MIVIERNEYYPLPDHVVDIGPEGGAEGGQVLFQGPVDQLVGIETSHTGKYLKPYLEWVVKEGKC